MSPFLWLSFLLSILVPRKATNYQMSWESRWSFLVLRCHLKDPGQSILCYPIYLPSKGEGLSWSFWDWNLWFQGNLSILTLRSLLLSHSSSIWQFIFVEFHNLDPGPVPLWNVSSFLLAPEMHSTWGKIDLLLSSQATGILKLVWQKWHLPGVECVYINSFHMSKSALPPSICHGKSSSSRWFPYPHPFKWPFQVLLLIVKFKELFIYFIYRSFIRYVVYKYFLSAYPFIFTEHACLMLMKCNLLLFFLFSWTGFWYSI